VKYTKIAVTVGPACEDPKVLAKLIQNGADLFRINASHTNPEGLKIWVDRIRAVQKKLNSNTAIFIDLQGPRVRTGSLEGSQPVILKKGELLRLEIGKKLGSASHIMTSCKEILLMISVNDPILIDNGVIELKVLKKYKDYADCEVIVGGKLGENKGINLPKAPVTLNALTAKDRKDLAAAAELGVTYVALSFVRSAADILAVKKFLKARNKTIPIIAKIEKPMAIEKYDEILAVSDAIMVARGDLGIELGVEKVPAIQKELIRRANEYGVPIITATQMLESMMEQPRPSRAEVSDIANAALDGTDAVMLSGETAVGKYPVEAVKMMADILREIESSKKELEPVLDNASPRFTSSSYAITHAAYHAARELKATAIVTFTLSGKTALLLSKMKIGVPIIALSSSKRTCLRLAICRGVIPVLTTFSKSTDAMIGKADKIIQQNNFATQGEYVILVSGKFALPAALYMTKIHRVGTV
jgi:pyruvate kinase